MGEAGGSGEGELFIGVDVGTGSARAGVFDAGGGCLATGRHAIAMFREDGNRFEQSSEDIWQAVATAVRAAMAAAGVAPSRIAGIGFDATCSLVVRDGEGRPLPVGPSGDAARDVIVWMDQRATGQAERINATGHPVLAYVGGRISPEMQTPKLLWLKENLPETYAKAGHFLDLTDYLTWRATGDTARSICTVTCKWTYLAHEGRWDESYFRLVGLEALADDGFARIGARAVEPGAPLGAGLTARAAADFGLLPGIPVAAGLIDAHAGGVGTIGAPGGGEGPEDRLGYVFGTSACTMSSAAEKLFVPGVWGPYYSAMVPGLWLYEGGQSAAGAAIDHLLKLHPAAGEMEAAARAAGLSLPAWLIERVREKSPEVSRAVELAAGLLVVPEFLGNRAPHADPGARAIVAGLDLDMGVDSMVALYVAGLSGLGYGLRQIMEAQAAVGLSPRSIVVSGGAGESPLVRQLLADACGVRIHAAGTAEPVLLGSAMLGAVAAGRHPDLASAMAAMSVLGPASDPATGPVAAIHAHRFDAFCKLQDLYRAFRQTA